MRSEPRIKHYLKIYTCNCNKINLLIVFHINVKKSQNDF